VPEKDTLRIELKGELAGILALSAERKSPAAFRLPGWLSKSRWLRGEDLNL
jgi:hypothetical protein